MRSLMRAARSYLKLTRSARAERRRDQQGLPADDPGIDRTVEEAVGWLTRAQDHSASHDGGVARHYSLLTGWGDSCPESTACVVPTIVGYATRTGNEQFRERAKRMFDWLVSIQLPGGAFQGGPVGTEPPVPTVFGTGQILRGLAVGVREFKDARYLEAMCRAGDWLVQAQDADGSWKPPDGPVALPGRKAYDTYVAWGLLEAARVEPNRGYADAALANVHWALGLQRDNGWFHGCDLTDPAQPLTHTLGYVLRGLVEAHRFTKDEAILEAALRTADGLRSALGRDGALPGRLNAEWQGTVPWVCLAGSAQVARCWLRLYRQTGQTRYRDASFAANAYVRRCVRVDGPGETRGGVKGSFPVDGGYETYQYPSWACKFLIDANVYERTVRSADAARPGDPAPKTASAGAPPLAASHR